MTITNQLQVQWLKGIIINHIGHSKAATHYKSRDRGFGLITTILSAVVSTALFSSLSSETNENIVLIAGILSLFGTIASAAFTFLKYGELSEQHRQAAISYGTLRREFELLLADENAADIHVKMQDINVRRAQFEKTAPVLPQRIFEKAQQQADQNTAIRLFNKNA